MPRTSDARERLIETAAALFQRQGYHGTGLTQILQESGAPKGSFYHHFPDGKEALAEAAVRQAGAEVGQIVDQAFEPAATFEDGARALVTSVADWFERSGYAAGCPVTSVLLETVPGSARLHAATRAALDDWAARVARHAEADGFDATAARRLGDAMVIALEGAWVAARARRNGEAFETAAAAVAALSKASR